MAELDFDLRDIYRVLRRRKKVIILSPIFVALLVYAISEDPPRQYEAEATVKVSKVAGDMQALLVEALSWYQGDNVETQTHVVESSAIRIRAARKLALRYERFREVDFDAEEPSILAELDQVEGLGPIEAEPKGNSDVIGVQATAGDAQLAVDLANAVAQAYIEHNLDEKNRQIDEAVRFIQGQIETTRGDLSEAEARLEEFKKGQARILGLDFGVVAELQQELSAQRRARSQLESEIGRLSSAQADAAIRPLNLFESDPSVAALEDRLQNADAKVRELRGALDNILEYQTESSPGAQEKSRDLKVAEQERRQALELVVQRLNFLKEASSEEIRAAEGELQSLQQVPTTSRELEVLQRNVDVKAELLNNFQRKLSDAQIQQAAKIQEVVLVESASKAQAVPQTARVLKGALGLLVGLLLGGVFAFLLESFDTSIGTIEEVERYLQLPVIGVTPHLNVEELIEQVRVSSLREDVSQRDIAHFARLCTHFAPTSSSSESFRAMRTHVESVLERNNWNSLVVTSSVLQEGKTSIACNLAVAFAQAGKRVLLVDADLRRPQVEKLFGLARENGLSDVLLGISDWRSVVKSTDDIILGKMGLENVHVSAGFEYLGIITTGAKVNNPAELLGLDQMQQILQEMQDEYDLVVFDVAPVLPVADATILTPLVDATLVAYQVGRVARNVIGRARTRLEGVGANVIGVILNDISAEIDYSSDYHYYSYSYYYEEEPRAKGGLLAWIPGFGRKKTVGRILPPEDSEKLEPPRG